jgi:hypothetical protein
MTVTTEEAERQASRVMIGSDTPAITAAALRSLAAERDALRVENARLREETVSNDITVNVSEIARQYKQGGNSWAYLSVNELDQMGVRIECAVLINGDLAEALKIARAALGEKE